MPTTKTNNNTVILIGFKKASLMGDFIDQFQSHGFDPVLVSVEDFYANTTDRTIPHMICVSLDLTLRKELADYIDANNVTKFTFVHKFAEVAKDAVVGAGSYIGPFCAIGSKSVIEEHCSIAPYCMVAHKARVGRGTLLHPNSILAGSSKIGEFCRLSLRATVIDHVNVCDYVELGAGALLTKDITETGKYLGSPARKIPTPYACRIHPEAN